MTKWVPTGSGAKNTCGDIMCKENCFSFEASNEYKNVNQKVVILILASEAKMHLTSFTA